MNDSYLETTQAPADSSILFGAAAIAAHNEDGPLVNAEPLTFGSTQLILNPSTGNGQPVDVIMVTNVPSKIDATYAACCEQED